MKKIKNTYDHIDQEYLTIADMAHFVRFGVLTREMIPEEYHEAIGEYWDTYLKRHQP
jgi:hypothetical protein